jgi:GTPase SAR1 family protein
MSNYEKYKIAMIGPQGSGKTALIHSLKSEFGWTKNFKYEATVGSIVHPFVVVVDGKEAVIDFWDFGDKYVGSEYRTNYLDRLNPDGTLVVYSTRFKSTRNALPEYEADARGVNMVVGTTTADRLRKYAKPYEFVCLDDSEGLFTLLKELVRRIRAARA